jgi:nitrite reductase/ring-hydroxylating ferredoxin subunit
MVHAAPPGPAVPLVLSAPVAVNRRTAMPDAVRLCNVTDVPVGSALKVATGALTLAVFNVGGTFYVTDDACTHGPGSLSEGMLAGEVVECNFHGGQFNVRTGEVVSPPCMLPLRTYRAIVAGGAVYIDVAPAAG